MTYEHDWTVRFADTDPFGIAHYPRIVATLHDVSDRFVEAVGYPFWTLTEEHDMGLPIVEVNVTFDHPIRAGDVVTIDLTPAVGNRSVRFEYEGRLPDGTVAFTAHEVRACVEVDGEGAVRVPDFLREAMAPYEEKAEGSGAGPNG